MSPQTWFSIQIDPAPDLPTSPGVGMIPGVSPLRHLAGRLPWRSPEGLGDQP